MCLGRVVVSLVLYGPMTTNTHQMAQSLADADRDAAIVMLKHSPMPASGRRRFVARLMLGSVFAQAGIHGLVDCTRCGDRGCEWCLDLRRLGDPA